jgi:hypothetical protein
MEQFNKVISFVLGLVVVIIFLAVATGRINLKKGIWPFTTARTTPTAARSTPTPTPRGGTLSLNQTQRNQTKVNVPTPNANYRSYNGSTPSNIPNTGPELLIPMAISSLLGGAFLKKMGKKE